ncbi:hypothetical protein Q8A73_010187 [Channa argus]|nr:hypothetical protein Q8A73_010187 [Channa argus]
MTLLRRKSWMGDLLTLLTDSLPLGEGAGDCSTWWTGRALVQRSASGFLSITSFTRNYLLSFTGITLSSPVAHLEARLRGGVRSRPKGFVLFVVSLCAEWPPSFPVIASSRIGAVERGTAPRTCFHPQTNSQVERYNQDLETTLQALCSMNPGSWSSQLLWAEYAHNSLVTLSSYSPFQAAYAYQQPLFPQQELRAASSEPAGFVRHTLLLKRQERICLSANRCHIPAPEYQVGDKVWLSSQDVPVKGGARKLQPSFLSPFPVTGVINPVAVRLGIPSSLRIHPVFHLLN